MAVGSITYLETQTKASDMLASRWMSKSRKHNEADWWDPHLIVEQPIDPNLL
ncbi:hypothetical protein HPP92_028511 [Vanilla planifolia]|uniref:Uncharacterized protein n=1 Tax=Vanilla planifolia TaxID=51239 RepID=A0A835P6Z2_VANPL|nr:hypothetical protein HPP92_028511 [Vanilla planifolia]